MTDDDRRAARRAFIRAAHPDRGGDADAFVRGLAAFDRGVVPSSRTPDSRPSVRRSRRPTRVARALVRELQRRRGGLPRRDLR